MLCVGIDLIEISRVERAAQNRRFIERVYGKDELEELKRRAMPAQGLAASFCAKEAFGKAMGTGIKGFSLNEVELLHKESGKPYLKLSGKAEKLFKNFTKGHENSIDVSITHTREYACAIVTLLGGQKNGGSESTAGHAG